MLPRYRGAFFSGFDAAGAILQVGNLGYLVGDLVLGAAPLAVYLILKSLASAAQKQ